jgi:hypothetical protein
MTNKQITTIAEVMNMIAEIHKHIDGLELTVSESYNSERCKLWGKQSHLLNKARESVDEKETDFTISLQPIQNETKVNEDPNKLVPLKLGWGFKYKTIQNVK